jgi:hypothetical protein
MTERVTEGASVSAGGKHVGMIGEVRNGRALVLRDGAEPFWADAAALRIHADGAVELDVAAILSARSERDPHASGSERRQLKGLF